MLDLFYPPKPVAIEGRTRRVLLMDAKGEVTPDPAQMLPKRPSKFDGWTQAQYLAYRREKQRERYADPARKEQVRAAGRRYRAGNRTPEQEAYAQRQAYLQSVEQAAVDAAIKNDARRRVEELKEARAMEADD